MVGCRRAVLAVMRRALPYVSDYAPLGRGDVWCVETGRAPSLRGVTTAIF